MRLLFDAISTNDIFHPVCFSRGTTNERTNEQSGTRKNYFVSRWTFLLSEAPDSCYENARDKKLLVRLIHSRNFKHHYQILLSCSAAKQGRDNRKIHSRIVENFPRAITPLFLLQKLFILLSLSLSLFLCDWRSLTPDLRFMDTRYRSVE